MNIVAALPAVVRDVLGLRAEAIVGYTSLPGSDYLALLVVLLAGISEAFGNSVVLFVNQVRFTRFAISLVASGVIFFITYVLWALSVYGMARFAFQSNISFVLVAEVVAFAYAPRIFGGLEFLPVLGRPVGLLLRIWSLVAVFVGLSVILELPTWQTIVSMVLGAAAMFALQNTVGYPLTWLARGLRRAAAGVNLVTDRRGLRALIEAGRGDRERR